DLLAELGVCLDERSLGGREWAGLGEDRLGDADLADVVEERAQLESLEPTTVETEPLADLERKICDPARVGGRVLVVRFERVGERLHRLEERPLEATEVAGVGQRELRLVRNPGQQAQVPLRELTV